MRLEDDDIKPHPEIWDKAVIGFAALLTLCAVGVCFFLFTVPASKPQAQAPTPPGEVIVGIPPKAK